MILLFLLLAILYCLEASTNIARKAGYNIKNASSGLFFQSALGIFSRLVMFAFMPILGFMTDTSMLHLDYKLYLFVVIPLMLIIFYLNKSKIELIFGQIIMGLSENGSYFKKSKSKYYITKSNYKQILSPRFEITYIIAGIPFLLSWPIIIIALILFGEYRATIIGMSAIFNGIYTLYLNIIVDPILSKLGNYKNIIDSVYDRLLYLKIISSIITLLIFLILVSVLLNL